MGNDSSKSVNLSNLADYIDESTMKEFSGSLFNIDIFRKYCDQNGLFPKSKVYELQQFTDAIIINPFINHNNKSFNTISLINDLITNLRTRGLKIWFNSNNNEKPIYSPDLYLSIEYTKSVILLYSQSLIDGTNNSTNYLGNDSIVQKDINVINYVLNSHNRPVYIALLDGSINDFKKYLISLGIKIDFIKNVTIIDLSIYTNSIDKQSDLIYQSIYSLHYQSVNNSLPIISSTGSPNRSNRLVINEPSSDSKLFRSYLSDSNTNNLMSQSLTTDVTIYRPVRPASSSHLSNRSSRRVVSSTNVNENISLLDLTIEQVSIVLQYLNMKSYVSAFVDNEIDGKTLAYIESYEELVDIGVTVAAKARILFDTIEEFKVKGVPSSYLDFKPKQRSNSAGKRPQQSADLQDSVVDKTSTKPKYKIGNRVLANYMSLGRWCSGTVTNSRISNHDVLYEITYDDQEVEYDIPELSLHLPNIRSPDQLEQLTTGLSVLANYKGWGKWYPGTIKSIQVLDSKTKGPISVYEIVYDDGERENLVYEDRIQINKKKLNTTTSKYTKRSVDLNLPVGSRIEGNYKSKGKWYDGVIVKSYYHVDTDENIYDILYDDGERENRVSSDRIRISTKSNKVNNPKRNSTNELSIPIGTNIEGNYKSKGKWYPGTIIRSSYHKPSSRYFYDILYDDKERETNVTADDIKLSNVVSNKIVKYNVNEVVEVHLKAKNQWINGQVVKISTNPVSKDKVYDIEIDKQIVQLDNSFLSKIYQCNDRVETYRNGRWLTGIISKAQHSNKKGRYIYDIEYDIPGETAAADGRGLTGDNIFPIVSKSLDLKIGNRVKGNYRGEGNWYLGTVTNTSYKNNQQIYDITYDDGEKEKHIPIEFIKRVSSPTKQSNSDGPSPESFLQISPKILKSPDRSTRKPSDSTSSILTIGRKILGNYQGKGRWYSGTIIKSTHLTKSNKIVYDILYDDGEIETGVLDDHIKSKSVKIQLTKESSNSVSNGSNNSESIDPIPNGSRIEGNYHDLDVWYPGTITNSVYQEKNERYLYDIEYDHGPLERGVYISSIRHLPTSKDKKQDDEIDSNIDKKINNKLSEYLTSLQSALLSTHQSNLSNAIESVFVDLIEPESNGLDRKLLVQAIDELKGPKVYDEIVDEIFGLVDKRSNFINYVLFHYLCSGKTIKQSNTQVVSDVNRKLDKELADKQIEESVDTEIDLNISPAKTSVDSSTDSKADKATSRSTKLIDEVTNQSDSKTSSANKHLDSKSIIPTIKNKIEELIDEPIVDKLVSSPKKPTDIETFQQLTNKSNEKIDKAIAFIENERIECNYKSKGHWFNGKISKVRDDGLYNVIYDDGESEIRVDRERIRKVDK